MIDSKYTKPILAIAMPGITINKRIYVPKLLPRITLQNVLFPENLQQFIEIPTLKKADSSVEEILNFDPNLRYEQHEQDKSKSSGTIYVIHKMKPMPDNYVKIRILSPVTLPKDRAQGKAPEVAGMACDRILIDIHGGGFIATSTRMHQTYLRRWANECNLVIFAIDYKLAPEVKYPAVFDDIWQAYFWIITQAERQLGNKD
jgi:hormone-sensitive lipase